LAAAPTAEPFPLAVLPAPMRQFVEEGAQACSCPPDYLAVPALALAGAAIGNARVLRIKHGYEVGTNLYTAIIGSPGSRKSPALELVAKPFYAKDYQVEADWRQKNLNLPEADRKPRQNIYVKDVTTEKLAECLRDSPRGLVRIEDELADLVMSLDVYHPGGHGGDLQKYLSLWSRAPIKIDRKSFKGIPLCVRYPFLTITGGLQPDLLTCLAGRARIKDGFMDRFLFAYPDELPAEPETWLEINPATETAWKELLEKLWALEMQQDGETSYRPKVVHLTTEAKDAWVGATAMLANELNSDQLAPHLRGPWAKLPGYLARLSLILQTMHFVQAQTSVEDVADQSICHAAQILEYFQNQAQRVYHRLDADPRVADAKRILKCLKDHWTSDPGYSDNPRVFDAGTKRFGRTKLFWNHLRRHFKRPEALDPPLELLVQHHHLRRVESDAAKRGPRPQEYEVNPKWNP
jgi:hypothetical protein